MNDFGWALNQLRAGRRVRRAAWANGCWIVLVPGSTITVEAGRPLGDAAPHLIGDEACYWPHIDMCVLNAGVPHIGPRTWGDRDLLAEDWED